MAQPRAKADVLAEAESALKERSISDMISTVTLDEKGRTNHKTPGGLAKTLEEQSALILTKAYFRERMTYSYSALSIEYAVMLVQDRHDCDESIFYQIVRYNPCVRSTRTKQLLRGLFLGLESDWIGACHILVPQFEECLRHLCEEAGFIASSVDEDLIQESTLLHKLLYEPFIEKVIGGDRTFHYRSLFVDAAGLNFRNRLAHGLLGDHEFVTYGPYIWACILEFLVWNKSGWLRFVEHS
jgi:hypothetical protein